MLAAVVLGPVLAEAGPAAALSGVSVSAVSEESTTIEPRAATTTPTPSPTLEGVPTISSPPDGVFIGRSTTTVAGTREADQEVQLLSPTGGDPLCIIRPDGTTTWTCDANLPNGASVVLRVVVTGQSQLNDQITVSVLGAPTVLGGPSGQSASNGMVRGTGEPGASVSPVLPNGQTCVATADTGGHWACFIEGTLASGSVAVTASQTKQSISGPSSSNDSAPVTVRFDLDVPAAPALASPRDGARLSTAGAVYSGTGETGATVTVFAGAYSVCTAVVSGGAWQCSAGGVAAGTYNVIAAQEDEAGNLSGGSPAVSVLYAEVSASPSPSASTTPTQPGATTSAPTDDATDAPNPTDSATTAPSTPVPTTPGTPEAAPSDDPGDDLAALQPGTWNDPTRFTTAVVSPFTGSDYPWLQAVLFAVGAVLLLAVPARLLAGTITRARHGRPFWRGSSLAGRNRVREEFETAPTVRLNRWLLGAAALVAAATLVMLSGPIVSEPAYLRLLVAVVIALFLVNLVASIAPLSWSSRVLKLDATITFLPRYLLLIFLTAIGSRVFGVEPALLFGLLGSVTVVAGATPAHRGQLATVRAASLIALAVFGWFVLGVLPAAENFGTALVAEIVNTLVLAAIGSAVFILVPIGSTSGRSILSWSPLVWVGLTLAALTVLFGVLSPVVAVWQSDGTIALLWVAAAAFAALSCGAWAWQRFVAPTQA
ncbi:hypothetical protein D6T64_17200 [Cryobacterium melibiosiphilum]|uniref:Bacterial Ig-like domain-containing protein n=1 Tax=Cryobacterium melibiosiphilum TaxID=995039 RepID=A0A3A5MBI1_9MICO|nr:hypothetical protein [Cryobacterium melibiosiphilum]RJT86872.1 hypothetical protein D6T64_17200 [Cryobacterium melibiosiphilum]